MPKDQSSNRRSEILRAAEKLMSTKGLSGVTTRQISREVGCSEGALYVHFKGRLELLLAMLEESLPDARQSLRALEGRAGEGSPQTNLVTAITGLYRFHRRVVPLFAGLFAEPKLLAAYRKSLIAQNKGPHLAIEALEKYIEVEQKLGRLDTKIDANLAASMLLSSCFLRAFVEHFFDRPMRPAWDKFAAQLVASIVKPDEQGKQTTSTYIQETGGTTPDDTTPKLR
jgi:AcrR family transcriptional regulator